MNDWVECVLGDICSFAKERIDVNLLSEKNYISTENMLPDKNGIVEATSLPSVNSVSKYQKDDVLVSNIRPYFKKIWFASMQGGCSNDVLVFRSKLNCNSEFLYYILSDNIFFDYVTKTSKGTKMPRGDKNAIMGYNILLPPLQTQKKIASILSSLDDKIEINTRMNKVLEEIARALFHRWFVEFEFPDAEGRPYKSSGGKMVESEMGLVPEGWVVGTLGDIAEIIDCLHSKKPERCDVGKPLLQLNNIQNDGLLDMSEIYFISEEDYSKWISRCEASKGDCVITNVGRVGAVAQIPEGVYAALGRNMTCVRCKGDYYFPTFLIEYLLSDPMRSEILKKTDTGTILDALNVKNIPKLMIVIPDNQTLKAFERILRPLRYKMEMNLKENHSLTFSRDTILPKLLRGDLVS